MQVIYDGRWGEKRLLVSFAQGESLIKLVVLINHLAGIFWQRLQLLCAAF